MARLRTIAALDPPLLRVPPIIAECQARLGRWAEAIALLRPRAAGDDGTLALLGYMYARVGQSDSALSIQSRLVANWRSGATGAYVLAFVPAGLGDRDEAFAWLDRAYDDGSLTYTAINSGLSGTPLETLKPDPRLDRLRARMGPQKR